MTVRDNDTRRRDPRQELAEELAETLSVGSGMRVARLLEALSVPAATRTNSRPPPSRQDSLSTPPLADAPDDRPPSIGIWTPQSHVRGWTYTRPPVHPLGDHHAAQQEFEHRPATGTRRIVFLGESVAAGYLLAPHWTPARALASRLGQLAEGSPFEVIDLARTNERLSTLLATWEASRSLDPEVWVIFAGNNWNLLDEAPVTRFPTTVEERQALALDLAGAGWEGPARRALQGLRRRVEAALDRIDAGAREHDARVVWVLPEVELATWEVAQPIAWTPAAGGARRWHGLRVEALERLAAGDGEGSLGCAEAMTAIDGGHHPTSHRLRVRSYGLLGAHDAAHQAACDAVDGAALARLGALASPQVDSGIQGWIRATVSRPRFSVVDLPWLFATEPSATEPSSTQARLPGPELFLDYCHLSAEGIDRAMTATAETVLDALGIAPSQEASALEPLAVPSPVRALAAVGAAVHGAHRHLAVDGGVMDSVSWLRRALDLDPALEILVDLAEARSGPLPAVLGEAQQRQLARDRRLLLQHGWRWDYLDADLLEALLEVLDEKAPERAAAIRHRLLEHHGVEKEPRELSRAPYLWQPLARLLPEVMVEAEASRRATLRSPWPTTDLVLVAAETRGVILDLVVRLPTIEGWTEPRSGEVTVALDGVAVASLPCKETWGRAALRLPASESQGPLHRLTLTWPALPAADEAALATAVERLEEGRETDLYPIFGEVARARAHRRG